MKLTVISNIFIWLSQALGAVGEHNKDKPIKLHAKFHDFYPTQSSP